MPDGDVEHVSDLPDGCPRHFPPSSQASARCFDCASNRNCNAPLASPSASFLPANSYSHFDRPGSHQAFPPVPNRDDYYPPNRTPLVEGSVSSSDNSAAAPRGSTSGRPTAVDSASPLAADTLESSRSPTPSQYRSTSYSSYRTPSDGSAKVPPALSSAPRSGQTSFKDLVNKFNNNSDRIRPLSPASSTREASRAGSPSGSADGAVRSRASTRLRAAGAAAQRGLSGSAVPDSEGALFTPPLWIGDRNVKSSGKPKSSNASRRPTFGELLTVDASVQSAGYAAPPYLQRRGSEGSVPSPNPASVDHRQPSPGLSPLTPTAWYLGQAPSLEAVNAGSNWSGHRRWKSDFSQCQSGAAFVDQNPLMAAPGPSQSGTFLESPHSKSRIPISSRHGSSDFVSRISSRPVGPDSTFSSRSAAQVRLPSSGASRLPKPSSKSPPPSPHHAQRPPGIASHWRTEMSNGRARREAPVWNPSLQAYVAAPPAKKSPPLRSSRPRQTVTKTHPSPGPSKFVETVSNFQKQINNDRDSRNPRLRERRLPELGSVDFATRRQRIQQAFNRTVQENERKEEEAAEVRRREQAQEGHDVQLAGDRPRDDATTEPSSQPEDTATLIDESTEICDEGKEPVPGNEVVRDPPQLHVDTSVSTQDPGPNTDSHLMTMDSPTLGQPTVTARKQGSERLGLKLANGSPSATTSGSAETHVTTFDNEPQTGLTAHNGDPPNQTLLSQIMQIRKFSSGSSSCDEPDYSYSGTDDRESIPIMLRDATLFGGSLVSGDKQGEHDYNAKFSQAGDESRNRWSLSSWSSSFRNLPSTDGQFEGIGTDLSRHPASADGSYPTTQSCSADSSTPPSVIGREYVTSAPRDDQILDQGNEETLQVDMHARSNAPSLARQGGWDSKRVTQLYLEKLARDRGHDFPMPAIRAAPHPRPVDADKGGDGRADSLTDDPVVVPRFEDLPLDRTGTGANLVLRDDWEHASPSIADWMQVAVEDDSAPPGKANTSSSVHGGAPPASSSAAEESLGLAINVQAAKEDDSEGIPPPPLPRRSPPPPPAVDENNHAYRPQSGQPRSAAPNKGPESLLPISSAGSSEDSTVRRHDPIPSPRAVHSSATSLAPSHLEQTGAEVQRKSSFSEQRHLKKRRQIIKELIDTENSFGRDMKVVDDIYKGTSSSCLDLSADDVKILFANSDQVVQFSTDFQGALKNAAKSVYVMPKSRRWSNKRGMRNSHASAKEDHLPAEDELERDRMTSIGEAFMTCMPQMEKVYADYLKNHDAANRKLQTLQRNPKVAIWLKECRDWAADLTSAWDLDSLLVKPVQRIVKYPLLLDQLLNSTPSDHPDYASIARSLEQVTNISVRINEMKKRADVVGQVVGRKRKESDVRAGLSKAFGRRTEKFKQQVGLSDMVGDKEYDTLAQRFGDSYFQLQVVMRDVEVYTRTTEASMGHLNEFVAAIEGQIDVAMSSYSELEGKWRQLGMSIREIMAIALPDHVSTTFDPLTQPAGLIALRVARGRSAKRNRSDGHPAQIPRRAAEGHAEA